jgi:hypothetical protein
MLSNARRDLGCGSDQRPPGEPNHFHVKIFRRQVREAKAVLKNQDASGPQHADLPAAGYFFGLPRTPSPRSLEHITEPATGPRTQPACSGHLRVAVAAGLT